MSDPGDTTGMPERAAQPRRQASPRSARESLQPHEVPPPPTRSRAARHPLVAVINFGITLAVIAIVAIGGTFLFAKSQFDKAGPLEEQRSVEIAEGMAVGEIAARLQDRGIIANRWVFRAGVAFYGAEGKLQAGAYLIEPRTSMRGIMDLLVDGDVIFFTVTLPEGLTSRQIVDLLLADPNLVGDIAAVPAEGTLLPETYQFNLGDTRQSILDRMSRDHDRVVAEVWGRRDPAGLPITSPQQLVILASIVEKETGIADERSRVAAVFINRLNRGIPLQSDPTVLYGLFGGAGRPPRHVILQSELDRPTPYNTYQIDGLPPGPITNPGRAALEAVANPSRTNELYFVADGNGGHAFAETLEQHNRNVARWRQIEAQQNAPGPDAPVPVAPAPDALPPVAPAPTP